MSRLVTTNTSSASVASQPKTESLTSLAIQVRVSVDSLRALPTSVFRDLVSMGAKGFTLSFYRDPNGQPFSQIYAATGAGSPGGTSFDMNALPANGNDVVIYADYISGGTVNLAMGTPGGGVIAGIDSTHLSALPALTTGSGTGEIALVRNADYDSVAIFSARRTGNARFAQPVSSDTNLIAYYGMQEGTGATFADGVAGGVAGTVGSATWATGGTWNALTGGGAATWLPYLQAQARMAGVHSY